MKPSLPSRSLTVRLNPELYESGVRVARRRRISLNSLVQESLERQIEADEDTQWREWFDELGNNPDESSVEFAAHAQAEVIGPDDRG